MARPYTDPPVPDRSELESRTRYDPAEVEPRIVRALAATRGCFTPSPGATAAENYSIAIPPPNVTGALHMGHALNGSIQDVLIRRHRMHGERTKWILGTDHAGIATQTQVERQLRRGGHEPRGDRPRGVRGAGVGVAGAVRRRRSSSSSSGSAPPATTTTSASRSTTATRARSLKVFVELYEKGCIYRDNYMVNWDPGSPLGDLRPRGRGPRGRRHALLRSTTRSSRRTASVTVATVRPETMLADTAVAVNPDDERYTRPGRAARRSCRSSGAACRSSPTTT